MRHPTLDEKLDKMIAGQIEVVCLDCDLPYKDFPLNNKGCQQLLENLTKSDFF